MKAIVSVIIPNYNYGRFLSEAIESVLRQTYKCHEIIVVDDGSTDDSLEVLARYKTSGVTVICQQNCGVSVARNIGAANSSGDVIAFLDADDVWLPTKIEHQMQALAEDSEIGLVSCWMREFDSRGATLSEFRQYITGWCSAELAVFKHPVVVNGSAIVVTRKVFENVGGFDEQRELHPYEDMEFCYRASKIGKIAIVPEFLVDYRNHGGNEHLKIPSLKRGAMLAFEKIFRRADSDILPLRREACGNLHSAFAGCYFQVGDYRAFLHHTARALWYAPQNFSHYLNFPLRMWQRRFSIKESAIDKQP